MPSRALRILSGVVFAIALVSSLAGCAFFRGDWPETVEQWPLTASAPPATASVVVTGEAWNDDSPMDASKVVPLWRQLAVAEIRGAGLFSSVSDGEADADRRIEIHVTERGSANMVMAFITGITLFVVPSKVSERIVMNTTVRDRAGNVLGVYEKSGSGAMWMQILFIFVMPFGTPKSDIEALFRDLTRASLVEAHAAGAL